MANELSRLLPQLTEQGYSAIYVLDDASTDNSKDIVASFGPEVNFVAGVENKGAGGNRNRIIDALGYDAFIHFLDADVELLTVNLVDEIRQAASNVPFGFIGGLVLNKNGRQSSWNFGPRKSWRSGLASYVQAQIGLMADRSLDVAAKYRRMSRKLLFDRPNVLMTPERKQVFWCLESNLVVDSRQFSAVGGFDENLREHEIMDLAIRMSKQGFKGYFDPRFAVKHTEGKVRDYNRSFARAKASFYIARKYGFYTYLFPESD